MFGDIVNIIGSNLKDDASWEPGLGFVQRHVSRRRLVACLQLLDFALFFVFALTWFGILAQPALQHRWLLRLAVSILAAAMMHCVFQCLRLYNFSLCTRGRKTAS